MFWRSIGVSEINNPRSRGCHIFLAYIYREGGQNLIFIKNVSASGEHPDPPLLIHFQYLFFQA